MASTDAAPSRSATGRSKPRRALDALLEDEDAPVRQPLTRLALRFRQSQALHAGGLRGDSVRRTELLRKALPCYQAMGAGGHVARLSVFSTDA